MVGYLGFAQILDNTLGQTFGEQPFFNDSFVKNNQIKSIKGFYSTKATLDIVRPTDDFYYYEFNKQGQLIKDYFTRFKDTLISHYSYDDKGNIASIRRSDKHGFYSYNFTYDSAGRVIEKDYRRDVNQTRNKVNFVLDRSFIVSVEKFEYVDFDSSSYKMLYYNNTGKVYKEEFYYFDEYNNLVTLEGRMKMGSGYNKTTYTYNNLGLLVEKTEFSKLINTTDSKWLYEYDAFGNVYALHIYKNGVYTTEYQIVYDQSTMLLNAIVTQDEETELLTILKFSAYTYYN